MFSKSKKQKPDTTMQLPKLRGMPALKHMRSTKREEYLLKKAKSGMPIISDLEHRNERQPMQTKAQFDERKVQIKVDVVAESRYKPPTESYLLSKSSAPVPVRYTHRNSESIGSDTVIHENITPPVTTKVDYQEIGLVAGSPASNSNWHFSKGDSGYKSQGDNSNSQDKKKTKKTKRKKEARSKVASGLHDIKQQRKASRESVSHSMRALTPKERESIRVLENVIKTANENDSADEVFNTDSDGNDNFEESLNSSCRKINEDPEEAIDYGYASVNDISRRFSIDSLESVGSIIDLVGNLSTSASSSTSPLYMSADKPQQHQVAKQNGTPTQAANTRVDKLDDNGRLLPWTDPYSRDMRKHYEDVLSHFDEVINSFSIPADEEDVYEDVEDPIKTADKSIASNGVEVVSSETKLERDRSYETTNGNGTKERRRKEKKNRDPEKEKERKERKKRRKEEKRALKREQEQNEHNEARLREENIARHVDTITALTQDMILTAQQEPIYAKVDKANKRKKHVNQNIESSGGNEVIDPPLLFANDHNVNSKYTNQGCDNSNSPVVIKPPYENFNVSSTLLASPESKNGTKMPFQESLDDLRTRSNGEHTETNATCLNCANLTPLPFTRDIQQSTQVCYKSHLPYYTNRQKT